MKIKTRLVIPFLILVPLAACQSEQPSTSTAPASHEASSPSLSTVAVTKETVETHVKDLQANIAQYKEAAIKAAEQLTESVKENAKPVIEAATKVDNAVKSVTAVHDSAPIVATTLLINEPKAVVVGDATKGKSLANKCKGCHRFTAKKKVGPGLKGIVGRKSGAMAGMKYSDALADGSWVWSEKNLVGWLCDSKKAVKTLSGNASAKTKMPAQRICDVTKQADLIAFLKTL